MQPIRILIADDHQLIRDGLRSMLENTDDLQVIGEAGDGKSLIELLNKKSKETDIILMDIKMPDKTGIELTQQVSKLYPHIKIIALTMFESDHYITGMLQAGAVGYLLKNTGKQEVIQALRDVAAGKTYFSESVTQSVMARFMSSHNHPADTNASEPTPELANVHLTKREKEILILIAGELTNQQIAERLFISPRTVETHRRNLIQKLGVKNTIGLIKFAISNGLIE